MELNQSIKKQGSLIFEILIVLGVMAGVKAIADHFSIIASGTIGIWTAILAATFFFKKRDITWKDLGAVLPKGRKDWLKQIGLGILAIASIFLITMFVLYVLKPTFGLEKAADAADKFRFFLDKPIVLIAYIIIGIWFGAGLGEELLIRGFLLNHLQKVIGDGKASWLLALLTQAVIFGFMHSYQGTMGIVITGLIAFSFGSFYLLAKRKLFPVVFAHAVFDTLTMVGLYVAESGV
ncbi:MAG: CPBP family intramembrane glutamic endopeptidase [Flagellimonas sp.]